MESSILKTARDKVERLSFKMVIAACFLFISIFISSFSSVSYATVSTCKETLNNSETNAGLTADLDN